jgi:formylmethanofuran dehydrogenase subunit E
MAAKTRNFIGITRCEKCNELITDETAIFNRHSLRNICKFCYNLQNLGKNLVSNYGISQAQFQMMSANQLNACALCKKVKKLTVDHNHKTNQVRSLLCHRCNMTLGYLNEDEDFIWDILEYLKRHELKNAV